MDIENILQSQWQQLTSVADFYHFFAKYQPTPLTRLPTLASNLGLANLMVKNESNRLGLGSFKGLGGIYAVTCIIQALVQHKYQQVFSLEQLFAKKNRGQRKNITFCCASAGNHGIAVTTGAMILGAQSLVYVAKTVPTSFIRRLRSAGAKVIITGENYEQSMAAAEQASRKLDYILISDSSWPGYTAIPQLIMSGYGQLAAEIQQSLSSKAMSPDSNYVDSGNADSADVDSADVDKEANKLDWPSHIFLQAGVGGMAMGLTRQIRENWPKQPKIIIVEPESALCLAKSVEAKQVLTLTGPSSVMGRLDCKSPSLLAFDYLSTQADAFIGISEQASIAATKELKSFGLATTPSGAAGYAGIKKLLKHPDGQQALAMNASAQCLFILSETSCSP